MKLASAIESEQTQKVTTPNPKKGEDKKGDWYEYSNSNLSNASFLLTSCLIVLVLKNHQQEIWYIASQNF